MSLAAVVLAAGEGKRLRTNRAKVLHEVGGRALIDHVLAALAPLTPDPTVVVIGHLRQQVADHLHDRGVTLAVQDPPRGTGDAVRVALADLPEHGEVLVLSGDAPLVRSQTLSTLVALRRGRDAAAALLTAVLPDGGGYGRIIRDREGDVTAIVEAREASQAQRLIREVNAGTYVFDIATLRAVLPKLSAENSQGEYYLTDTVAALVQGKRRVAGLQLEDADEMLGVNSRAELAEVHRRANRRTLARLQEAGVTVLDAATIWVDQDCSVGADTVLEPGVVLRHGCRVGRSCLIGAHAVLDGAVVADGAAVSPLTFQRGE